MGVFKNDVGRPSNKTIKKRNILKGICLLLLLCIIGLIAYIINDWLKDNEKNNKVAKEKVEETSDGWYEPLGAAKTINIYGHIEESTEYSDKYIYIRETEHEDYDDLNNSKFDYLNSYKCTNKNCTLKDQISKDFSTVLIKDGDYLVYNFKTNKAKKIDLGKKVNKLNYIDKEEYMCDGLGSLCIESRVVGKNTYYVVYNSGDGVDTVNVLIGPDLKPIILYTDEDYKNDEDRWNKSAKYVTLLNNGNVMYIKDNKFYTYDSKTGKITDSRKYKSVELISDEYIVVVDNDDYLKVLDLNGKEKAKLVKITDDMIVHTLLSGWYEQDKKAGIYVVVEDPSVTCDNLSEKMKENAGCNSEYDTELGYEYYYIPKTGEIGKIATYIGGYAKPVLYLYPKNDNTKVSVSFAKPNLLTTTYPKYRNSWVVTANKNGDLYDENEKYYYGLYWEESGSSKVTFNEGFYVTKDNAIDFLEEKLSIIGLNDKERNEFIMYWLPILEKNEKSLVYFELTDSREKYNKLYINPKPDSMLRMAIHIKKINKKINIKEQKLPTFERKGFTVIEWGGVIH